MLGRNFRGVLLLAVLSTLDGPAHAQPDLFYPSEYRTIAGTRNNPEHPDWGSAGVLLRRSAPADYEDGVSVPPGRDLAGPREISNSVAAQSVSRPNGLGVSDFLWQWGQFLDHDTDLTVAMTPPESLFISVPIGDPYFDPDSTGTAVIPFFRSRYEMAGGPRQQVNEITAFIDASNVYGSDPDRARALRTLDGTGRLATSPGDLLPYNVMGLPNEPDPNDSTFFLAGDIRANEQVGLIAMHTLFVREHNHWADWIRIQDPSLTGDDVYQLARAVVAAEMQIITYQEFLPLVLGVDALGPYPGYRPDVDPGIANEFSTAAYRFGHSMLSSSLLRLDEFGDTIPEGNLPLEEAFFSPEEIVTAGGIEPVLRGLAMQQAQEVDVLVVDAVRNFLFGPPGAGGFDLASLNLQRGRDHGLPRYEDMRVYLGLRRHTRFEEVTSDPLVQTHLASVYDSVDDIDLWIGALAEDHYPGSLVGELIRTVLVDQFRRLRNCDRFWYEGYLPQDWITYLETQSLATILRRVTDIGTEIQDDVLRVVDVIGVASLVEGTEDPTWHIGAPAPNPSDSWSAFDVVLPELTSAIIDVGVYDVTGRRLATLFQGTGDGGTHRVRWDGRDGRGNRVAGGIYFIRGSLDGRGIRGQKLVLLRR